MPRRRLAYLAAVLIIAPSVLVMRLVPWVEAAAAAPVLLLSVLIVARNWGTGPALLASTCAALSYSYFLPPDGFGLANVNDWVEFVTFTVTAIIVGELAASAERRHLEAQEGRREIERLYQELQAAFDRASEAEAARRSEQLKAALLDALTHNLRTPLTAIKAAVTGLIGSHAWSGASALSSESEGELLEVINEESDRLNRFIEGLSAAGPIDHAQPQKLPASRLQDILRAGLARAETVTRDHRVIVELDETLPPLSVDAASMTEVLYILLDNASKYAPPHTEIRVGAVVEGGHYVRITVADEGPGVPPGMHEQVFDKFFKVPGREPRDPRRAGVGLGLPIARRLVEAQAGHIWIEEAPGGGTSVSLTLPVAPEEIQQAGYEQPPDAVNEAGVTR